MDLSRRLKDYYSPSKLKKANNYIRNALIYYTHSDFSLTIIEYINIPNLSKEETRLLFLGREQHHLDSLAPKYSKKIAGSSLEQRRSEGTKTLISIIKSGKTYFIETKAKISFALKGENHSELT